MLDFFVTHLVGLTQHFVKDTPVWVLSFCEKHLEIFADKVAEFFNLLSEIGSNH